MGVLVDTNILLRSVQTKRQKLESRNWKMEKRKPHSCHEAVKKPPCISFLQKKYGAVSSRHEPRKAEQQATIDPTREPSADDLAGGGRGTTDR